ncbi:MAG: TatD DNase family protein [Planctomycetota bacterium]
MITDSHAHVFWNSFDDDRADVLARAREVGVDRMLIVGTDLESSRAAFELCRDHEGLYPTAGIHPHDAGDADDATRSAIEAMCRREECVAVGETGFDFFKEYSPREAQAPNFDWHLKLAGELGKPIIVHCRDAHEETVAMLSKHPTVQGVMHCYTMGTEELPSYLDLGYYISFSGVVTYPKNDANREAAKAVPDDRLLVETDCPFLSPQGHRGKRNEPALVKVTLEFLAELRGTSLDELARITSDNATRLFGLK